MIDDGYIVIIQTIKCMFSPDFKARQYMSEVRRNSDKTPRTSSVHPNTMCMCVCIYMRVYVCVCTCY